MSLLTIVNEQLNAFAAYVKIARFKRGWSLRDLAKMTGLSHTFLNRVENANTRLTKESLDKIVRAFNERISYRPELEDQLEQRKHRFHEALFYNEDEVVESIYAEIKANETYYMNSLDIIDYLLMMQGYAYMRNVKYHDHSTVYDEYLALILDRLSKEQEAMFYMYRGLSRYSFQERSAALEDLLYVVENAVNTKWVALSSQIIGRIYSDQQRLHEAEIAFASSRRLYEEFNHFMTSVYVQTYQAINRLKLKQFEGLGETFENLLKMSKQKLFEPIREVILIHTMLYKLTIGKNQEVLAFNEQGLVKNPQYYFYRALASTRLTQFEDEQIYQEQLAKKVDKEQAIYQLGIEFVLAVNRHETLVKAVFVKAEQFFNAAINQGKYLDAHFVFPYLVEYHLQHRQYKKAHELNMFMIEVMRGK